MWGCLLQRGDSGIILNNWITEPEPDGAHSNGMSLWVLQLLSYVLNWDWLACPKAFQDLFNLKGRPLFIFLLLLLRSGVSSRLIPTYFMRENDLWSVLCNGSALIFACSLVSINLADDHSKRSYWRD